MSQNLVIVESPAKARTIENFLGKEYKVLASYGHVRALPSKQGSVDVENDFEPKYAVLPESKKHLSVIKQELKHTSTLLLATDPDREGEAISWHLLAALGLDAGKSRLEIKRVVFHEITKDAIIHAVKHPRDISLQLVDAQQARSILDYLVGFNLSPFLWNKIRYGLSAGRVQSVALRLICEREKEIAAFTEREYWTISASLKTRTDQCQGFKANLIELGSKKLGKFDIPDKAAAEAAREQLLQEACQIAKVSRTEKKRYPSPPFTTSTLQQEAARKLGFSAKKTMSTAQKLYEGIDLGGEGTIGLITYMRTDSVNLSSQALKEAQSLVSEMFGQEYALAKPRHFKNKAKNAQEAHEAIRPTYLSKTPAEMKKHLTPDQFKLYELIWKRTMASQMAEALLDLTSVDISAGKGNTFRATGSVIRFPGFMKLYIEGIDDGNEEKEGMLPPLEEGEFLDLAEIVPEQHFTQPPPRYTEATLVKTLEEYGIGRPSTYASILNTLLERKYAVLEKKRFIPEDTGMVVNDLLTDDFPKYVDYNFTAGLEEELDQVSRGEKEWKQLLRDFWGPFSSLLGQKLKEPRKVKQIGENCPECGQPLVEKLGKRGKFIACSGYQQGCRYTRAIEKGEPKEKSEPVFSEEKCEKCGSPMLIKEGRYGKYLACSSYPECKNIQPLVKPRGTGITCPECGKGELIEKKSRYGKMFYSCNRYPDCKFALWDPPVAQACPSCGFPLLVQKVYKRQGAFLKCPKCDYKDNSEGGSNKE
ncbi:MAG: type I DNA topoisomerase [Geobacteraceae bacterium]|nr:type I DNA topoisomerase [Geobacteraceae bacterium]